MGTLGCLLQSHTFLPDTVWQDAYARSFGQGHHNIQFKDVLLLDWSVVAVSGRPRLTRKKPAANYNILKKGYKCDSWVTLMTINLIVFVFDDFPTLRREFRVFQIQYHDYWCPGDARILVTSRFGVDLGFTEFSARCSGSSHMCIHLSSIHHCHIRDTNGFNDYEWIHLVQI